MSLRCFGRKSGFHAGGKDMLGWRRDERIWTRSIWVLKRKHISKKMIPREYMSAWGRISKMLKRFISAPTYLLVVRAGDGHLGRNVQPCSDVRRSITLAKQWIDRSGRAVSRTDIRCLRGCQLSTSGLWVM